MRRLPADRDVPGADDLRARMLATLAHSEAELGRVPVAEDLLDAAMGTAAIGREATGIVLNQRGLLRLRQGRLAGAVADFDRAVDALADRPAGRCVVLLNRSAAHLYRGDVRAAADDLHRCAALAAAGADTVLAAKARHNLGYLALLRRDLPAALRELSAAHDALAATAPGYCGVVRLDRARALRDAGLFDDAETELDAAIAVLREHRLAQDLGEALLASAEVAELAGRHAAAAARAAAARRRFRRGGNEAWALLADLVLLQATSVSTRPAAARALPRARALAARLRAVGLADEARSAGLVADGIELVAGGEPAVAPIRRGDRIGLRLQTRLVRAEAARARGDDPAARRELRRGLADLHRHRASLGSYDLRTGAGAHGRRLVEAAVRDALRDGRPAVVHDRVERARAVSLRMASVRPPDDPDLAAAIADVRALRAAERAAAVSGRPVDRALRERRTDLEHMLRRRSWELAGQGGRDRVGSLAAVRAALAPSDGALVSYVAAGGRLAAVVATRRRAALVEVGALGAVTEQVPRLRADLDLLARGNLPASLRAVVAASARNGLSVLDAALWRPVAGLAGTGPLVVVPTGVLGAVPWTCLDGLRGRPLTVAPSASWWAAAARHRPLTGAAAFAAGPGLDRATQECHRAARHRAGATVLAGPDATAARVLDLAGRCALLHLAAHGRHEPHNPLFSSVEMADGPVLGYDLPRLARAPAHVVLSACDVGLAVVRAGDELLGMTAAFLHAGSTSVVASTAQLGDEAACEAMARYHGHLAAGRSPAEALAAAGAGDLPLPLVGFGAAW